MGAGALGSVLGALLSRRNDVLLVTRGRHLDAIKENGLRITGLINEVFHLDAEKYYPGGFDLVIITVKAYQTEEAKKAVMREYSGEMVITFQNGVGIVDMLKDLDIIGGSTSMGATRIAPGIVKYAGEGDTYIGEVNGKISERVIKIAKNFTSCGIETVPVDNIIERRWIKAAVNACINPLTAILGIKNGELRNSYLNNIVRCVARECEEVLKDKGITADIYTEAEKVIDATSENISSMLQDIKHKRRTEIDYILRPFLSGKCSETLYWLIKHKEKSNN